jgi:hypothetical protein
VFSNARCIEKAYTLLELPYIQPKAALTSVEGLKLESSGEEGHWPDVHQTVIQAHEVEHLKQRVAMTRVRNDKEKELTIAMLGKSLLIQQQGILKHKSRNKTTDETKCAVCFEDPKCILLDQCNHLCLCVKCALKSTKGLMIRCPMCRFDNISWRKVFL